MEQQLQMNIKKGSVHNNYSIKINTNNRKFEESFYLPTPVKSRHSASQIGQKIGLQKAK